MQIIKDGVKIKFGRYVYLNNIPKQSENSTAYVRSDIENIIDTYPLTDGDLIQNIAFG